MKNGQCPMCGSRDIYANATADFQAGPNLVEADFLVLVPYVCRGCGFTAMYVDDMQDLEDLPGAAGWNRVTE